MITTIQDISILTQQGFTDWTSLGRVNVKEWNDLLLFDYQSKCQYEGLWNYFETVSRGLIVHKTTGEIVARPFDKFFNWGERGLKGSGHIKTITEKKDGSLGCFFRYQDQFHIATRGSFESSQALWATNFFNQHYGHLVIPNNWTLLFEIIYPENRIVVDYGDRQELVLLAVRDRFTGEYKPYFPDLVEIADTMNFPLPETYTFNNVSEVLASAGELDGNHEGFVIEMSDGTRWKIKGDRYLELHKAIAGLSFKSVLGAVENNTVHQLLEILPDEFSNQVQDWVEQINEQVIRIKAECRNLFEQAPTIDRREFALWCQTNCKGPYRPILFNLLDGKDNTKNIYKLIIE
jgi:RNA ligase